MQHWKDIIHLVESGQSPHPDPVVKTEEDWKGILDEQTYRITREGGTEVAGSGSHCSRFEPGIYTCSCCKIPLFNSTTKFESVCLIIKRLTLLKPSYSFEMFSNQISFHSFHSFLNYF